MQIPFLKDDRIIHSIKTAFAVLIGFAITKSVHFPVDQWLIITILVVMCAQMNVGSMLQKSYMRFLGTLLGSFMAGLTLILFGTNPIAIAITVSISTMLFSYIATSQKNYSDSGTLGAVTTTIILIGQNPTLLSAIERCIEISIGIVIAALVSQFILPIHARRNLLINQAQTIRKLSVYYRAIVSADKSEENSANLQILDEAIAKSLINQRKLAVEAARETLRKSYQTEKFQQLLWYEKEILRSIAFISHAYGDSMDAKNVFSTVSIINDFNETMCMALETIADHLSKKIPVMTITLPNPQYLSEAIHLATQKLNPTDAMHANGFLFCANILIARMEKLILFVSEMNQPAVKSGIAK